MKNIINRILIYIYLKINNLKKEKLLIGSTSCTTGRIGGWEIKK